MYPALMRTFTVSSKISVMLCVIEVRTCCKHRTVEEEGLVITSHDLDVTQIAVVAESFE